MRDAPKIEISGLFKSFGPKKVLRGVDLTVGTGESVVVIGGSGSGKSVLLKCILGLMRPESGSIRIDGEESVDLSRRRSGGEPEPGLPEAVGGLGKPSPQPLPLQSIRWKGNQSLF